MATVLFGMFVFLAALGPALVLFRRAEATRRTLGDRLPAGRPEPAAPPLAALGAGLVGALPLTAAGRADLRTALAAAGDYHPAAPAAYTGLRVALVVGALACAQLAALVLPADRAWVAAAAGVGLAVGGYWLPAARLSARVRVRREAIEQGLPFALDLVSVGLAAGEDLRGALARAADDLRRADPVLAGELTLVARQAELYSVGRAVRLWADRSGVEPVRDLARVLAQAEELGTGAAAALEEYAGHMRFTARTRAEARASRMSFWMMLPTLSCFWLAAAILLVAPTAIQIGPAMKKHSVKQSFPAASGGKRP